MSLIAGAHCSYRNSFDDVRDKSKLNFKTKMYNTNNFQLLQGLAPFH